MAFIGNVAHGQTCQTIVAKILSTSPAADPVDTVIKICKGTTVSFSGAATFSGSSAGATYEWHFNDGTVLTGTGASKTFPDEGVYIVDFVVKDQAGCKNKNCDSRRVIHVSTTPHFDQIQKPDTVCINSFSSILGKVTPIEGKYNCAPPVAGTTFLPDGNGVTYSTSINVSCFTPCDTVRAATDIESICMSLEHSYTGDLRIEIECPNGQRATMLTFPNGINGKILGEPVTIGVPDMSNLLDPGIGYTYCYSPTATAVLGTITEFLPTYTDVLGNVSTNITRISAGTYAPFQSFSSLIGCPLNGNWTIHITDNQFLDNGYIFNWGIEFSQLLGNYSFLPGYKSEKWLPNPDIVSTSNGGKDIIIHPTNFEGLHCYTYEVVDSFDCKYDTTVCVYVIDPGNPGRDTSVNICLNHGTVNPFYYLAGQPDPGGTWSGPGITSMGMFNPSLAGVGEHTVTYRLKKWNCDTTANILFKVVNNVDVDFSYLIGKSCNGDTVTFTNLSEPGQSWWRFGDGSFPDDTTRNPIHLYAHQGNYTVRLLLKNELGCMDSIVKTISTEHPLIARFSPDADSVCQPEMRPIAFTDRSVGDVSSWQWDFGDGAVSQMQNPQHTYSLAGTHTVRLIVGDKIPCYDTVYQNVYVDSTPFIRLYPERFAMCEGEALQLELDYLRQTTQRVSWDFGDGTHWDQDHRTSHSFGVPGKYWITAVVYPAVCPPLSATDSIVVNAFPKIDLGPDSVLCLGGSYLLLEDKANMPNPSLTYRWNTGAATPSIKVTEPGLYSLTLSAGDCASQESVRVDKGCYTDIPNAFTPNGDGENDYFFPRSLLSKGVVGFSMTVYNRWGQKVFETNSPSGRGWDGKFNGSDQPVGTYVYHIQVAFTDGRSETYDGNVTLLR